MEQLVDRVAGLDVHRDTVVVTVRRPRPGGGRLVKTLTFATTVAELTALGDWLVAEEVELAGMESTGVYWKPVYFLLEEQIPQVWLLNAEHLHNVPGRKTDVADSAWIAQLLEHGLVAPSFVPPAPIRRLRDLTRHRRVLIEERTRVIQRLEKALQDAGIKLTSVASTLLCKSGRAILDAQMLAHVDFLDESIAEFDARIEAAVADYQPVLTRLVTIPGVARKTAISLLAEIGVDMSVFPTPAHLASWAGICPGNNASGGKARAAHTRHGSPWLKTALTEAAQAAARTKGTYLAAHHAAIRGRRGTYKAIGATRHDLLIAYWHIVHDEVDYRELGADWAQRRHSREHQTRRLIRQLEALGHHVQLTDAA